VVISMSCEVSGSDASRQTSPVNVLALPSDHRLNYDDGPHSSSQGSQGRKCGDDAHAMEDLLKLSIIVKVSRIPEPFEQIHGTDPSSRIRQSYLPSPAVCSR
jgi:hypothetical protein